MKKIVTRMLLTGFAMAVSCAAHASEEILRMTADRLTVEWRTSVSKDSIGRNQAMEVTPMVVCGGDTIALEPAVFRSGLNRKVTERGRYFKDLEPASAPEYATGEEALLTATFDRADYPGLWTGEVRLIAAREVSGCCETRELPALLLGATKYETPFRPAIATVPDFTGKAGQLQRDNPVLQHISQYRPYDSTRILRKEDGALYVHFPLDQTVVYRDFRDNSKTLDEIVSITREIMADSTSNVKIIQIIGLASVEGPLKHNLDLGANRAEALKRYIRDRVDVPEALFECNNGGEAWTELRDQISDLDFPYRERLLEIIDTEPNADRREARIKALDKGKAFAYLLENVLSDQRNSGYLRIYYDYVPDEAAAVINGASALLGEERYAEALAALEPVKGDPRSWNALGVALYMTGDTEGGLDYFRRAAANGNAEAADNLRQLTQR